MYDLILRVPKNRVQYYDINNTVPASAEYLLAITLDWCQDRQSSHLENYCGFYPK